jgi:hypothetical protein
MGVINPTHLIVDVMSLTIFAEGYAYKDPAYVFPRPILPPFPLSQIQTFCSEPCSQYPEFPLRLQAKIIFENSYLFHTFNIEKANSIILSYLLLYSTVCYKLHFDKRQNILIRLTQYFL